MKKNTLTAKLVFAGVAIVLISVISIGLVAVITTSDQIETLMKNDVNRTAGNLADLVQLAITHEMNLAKEIALNPHTVDSAAQAAKDGVEKAAAQIALLQRQLTDIQSNIGQNYEAIIATDQNGFVFADSLGGKLKGINVADRDYFKGVKQGKCYAGSVVKSKSTGKPIAPFAAPILSKNKEVIGALVIVLKTDYLVEEILGVNVGKSGYAYVVDQNGIVIAHRNPDLILSLDIKTSPGMEKITKAILAGESGVEYYSFRGVEKVAGYAHVEMTKWSVVATEPMDDLMEPVRDLQKHMALIAAVILALITGVVLLLGRKISKPITRAALGLSTASDQVASASAQISSSSQQLAEGASEQAASIEETSSSLEEMASMVGQNAENADQCRVVMEEAKGIVGDVNKHMTGMSEAIGKIQGSSEETVKIIKTIDEIAFQTNLLALNAAVEAARAGEAGAGFAVVADEVRSLALRAAEAAKITGEMIENTVKSIRDGSGLMELTQEAFQRNIEIAQKVGELVGEIAAASREQAQGIEQINTAVSEMDRVTQQNASSAEESASASEEMAAQAEKMRDFVGDLVELVGGKDGRSCKINKAAGRSPRRTPVTSQTTQPSISSGQAAANGNRSLSANSRIWANRTSPGLFPLDDSTLKDF